MSSCTSTAACTSCGNAVQAAGLAAQVGRRTRATVISVDHRLAPEHPYSAAVDDALAAYQALLDNGTEPSGIAFDGEPAGGGLAVGTLVNARDHGLPLPTAAFVMSPYADLTLAGGIDVLDLNAAAPCRTAGPGRQLRRRPRGPSPGNTPSMAQLRWQEPAYGSDTMAMAR